MTDTVSLLKQNGEKVEKIKASVQKNKIFIHRSDLLIETGDLIQRKMSNGAEETYKVIDPGFHERFYAIEAHYQIEVQKLGLPEARTAVQHITFNVTGNNARINQNSIDKSTNVVHISNEIHEKVSELRNEITQFVEDMNERENALQVVDAIEEQIASGNPKRAVVDVLLKGLPTIANIASIGASIMTLLG